MRRLETRAVRVTTAPVEEGHPRTLRRTDDVRLALPARSFLEHRWFGYILSAVLFLAALGMRFLIHPMLPAGFPFITFFPAVVLATYLFGVGPGIVCAIMSGLSAWYFFLLPPNSFELDRSVFTALLLFTSVAALDIVLIGALQRVGFSLRASRIMERQLAERTALLDLALQAANAGTWVYDVASGRAVLSAEMARQHGLGDAEIEIDVERDWRPRILADDAERTLTDLGRAIATGGPFETEFRVLWPDGTVRWLTGLGRVESDATGTPVRVTGLSFDITQRKEAETQVALLARYDSVTTLPNRLLFKERFAAHLDTLERDGTPFALLCLDLDRFKAVNDTLGHLAGDMLLSEVANRLTSTVRVTDTVARIGGDEFVIIQADTREPSCAAALAERISRAIAVPMVIDGLPVEVGVSIGIAMAPRDGLAVEHLHRAADEALYRAKREGRNTFRFADASIALEAGSVP